MCPFMYLKMKDLFNVASVTRDSLGKLHYKSMKTHTQMLSHTSVGMSVVKDLTVLQHATNMKIKLMEQQKEGNLLDIHFKNSSI